MTHQSWTRLLLWPAVLLAPALACAQPADPTAEAWAGCQNITVDELLAAASPTMPGWPGSLRIAAAWRWQPVSTWVQDLPEVHWGCRGLLDLVVPSGAHIVQKAQIYRRPDGRLVIGVSNLGSR